MPDPENRGNATRAPADALEVARERVTAARLEYGRARDDATSALADPSDPEPWKSTTPEERGRLVAAWLADAAAQAELWAVERDRAEWRTALAAVLDRTRPWADERATRDALTRWWNAYMGRRGVGTGPLDIAAELHALRDAGDIPADVTETVALMLANVAAGRAPRDYGFVGTVTGLPSTTRRDYLRLRRDSDPTAPLRAVVERVQRQRDLVSLRAAGWKVPAARRLLERYPGWHAHVGPDGLVWKAGRGAVGDAPPCKPRSRSSVQIEHPGPVS